MTSAQLGPEVQLAWEVMTCLGLRTTYDRADSPCHWFNAHYGPYPAYSLKQDQPGTLLKADQYRSLKAETRGMRYPVPELMSGCRKAPIMSIGINPNLTAWQRSVNGAVWCYPYFDDIQKYADHFRNRTIHQERFPVEFIRKCVVPGTETRAKDDGEVTDVKPGKADNINISVKYATKGTDLLRVPLDHELLFDKSAQYKTFKSGEVLAGKIVIPEGIAADVIQEPVGYYQQFQKVIERFKASDDKLQRSAIQVGEDACQADMVACASPGWNDYFPDAAREGITAECVVKRRYLARQFLQTRPAAIVFAGSSAVDMFLGSLKPELDSGQVAILPHRPDLSKDTMDLLRECSTTPYVLRYRGDGVSFDSRLVFSPHFSYGENFTAGCWMTAAQWQSFSDGFKDDAAKVSGTRTKVLDWTVVQINPASDEWKAQLTPAGAAELQKYYLDPVGCIAGVLSEEYKAGRMAVDDRTGHLIRTGGGCRFCDNELFQLPGGCRYSKEGDGPQPRRFHSNAADLAICALHGAAHTCPADTLEGYWAALGAGADAIVVNLELTKSQTAVCCPAASLPGDGATTREVLQMEDPEFFKFDAGAAFQSTVLNENNQPTGDRGKDFPWKGVSGKKRALSYPTLAQVLNLFGRRTRLLLMIRGEQGTAAAMTLADKALQQLRSCGLAGRVVIVAPKEVCAHLHELSPVTQLACMAVEGKPLADNINTALSVGAQFLFASFEELSKEGDKCRAKLPVSLLVTSSTMPIAPTPEAFGVIGTWESASGLCFPGVEVTVELRTPPARVLADSFSGTQFDRGAWACGYSHQNKDTTIKQDNGVVIDIVDGGEYSGAAAVTVMPVHGSFDARVDFHVTRPAQGTTFEMAAIGIDPGYFNIDNSQLDSKTVNLTFDVHGAPPYASSERDEDDGFRVGWNNGYNLTKIDADWAAASANMYNKYGRDVGYGAADSPSGTLRLVRTGAVFNAYYQDKFNSTWVCSGSALVPNLGPDAHIRLGAKHWQKTNPQPPGNTVTFTRFELYQF